MINDTKTHPNTLQVRCGAAMFLRGKSSVSAKLPGDVVPRDPAFLPQHSNPPRGLQEWP